MVANDDNDLKTETYAIDHLGAPDEAEWVPALVRVRENVAVADIAHHSCRSGQIVHDPVHTVLILHLQGRTVGTRALSTRPRQ